MINLVGRSADKFNPCALDGLTQQCLHYVPLMVFLICSLHVVLPPSLRLPLNPHDVFLYLIGDLKSFHPVQTLSINSRGCHVQTLG